MPAPEIFLHDSYSPSRRQTRLCGCLRRRTLDASFHYESPAQVAAWLELHEASSPARRDPAVAAIYGAAIRESLERGTPPSGIASLGCGGGWKDLIALRAAPGAAYAAIDASRGMVAEALAHARDALPGISARGLVADLADARGVARWTFDSGGLPGGPVLWLAFGIVPNLPAADIPLLFDALLRKPGDRCLVGANLIPGRDPAAEMAAVLPQYDNAPTRRWLALLPRDLGLPVSPDEIALRTVPSDGAAPARFEAVWTAPRSCATTCHGERFAFASHEELRLFFSNRFTPWQVEELARAAGLCLLRSTISPAGDEGVFEIGR